MTNQCLEVNPKYSLKELMLKLNFGHLKQTVGHLMREVGLKLSIQKTKIMTSSPITSWPVDGETMETVTDFIFWAPKSLQMVTAAMKLKDVCS